MNISYEGIGQWAATFAADAGAAVGKPVKVSTNNEVALCADNDDFCGVIASVARGGDACTVQLGGMVTLPYSGTAPTVGYGLLAADGAGGVKTVQSGGRSHLIVAVDTAGSSVTMVL